MGMRGVGSGPVFGVRVPAGLIFKYKRVGGLTARGLPNGGTVVIVSSNASVGGCNCLSGIVGLLARGSATSVICSGVLPGPVGDRIVRTTTVYHREKYSFVINLNNKDSVSSTGTVTMVTYGSNSC